MEWTIFKSTLTLRYRTDLTWEKHRNSCDNIAVYIVNVVLNRLAYNTGADPRRACPRDGTVLRGLHIRLELLPHQPFHWCHLRQVRPVHWHIVAHCVMTLWRRPVTAGMALLVISIIVVTSYVLYYYPETAIISGHGMTL